MRRRGRGTLAPKHEYSVNSGKLLILQPVPKLTMKLIEFEGSKIPALWNCEELPFLLLFV